MLVYADPCIHHRRDCVDHVGWAIHVHHRESESHFSQHHTLHASMLKHCCQRVDLFYHFIVKQSRNTRSDKL